MASEADDLACGFLEGGGVMAARIRDFDWARTPLGPISGWPPILKATISLILRSPVPLVTLWGELGIMIYNDAYSVFAGERNARLLGSEVRKGWEEVADWNDNVMKVGLAGGTLSYRDQMLMLARRGAPEEVWLDLDYSPITDEGGTPVGVIAIVVEITDKVRVQHRAAALAELGEAIRQTADPEDLAHAAGLILGRELKASRAGYGTMDVAAETIVIGRHFHAPDVADVSGVVSFRKFGSFIEDLKNGTAVIVTDTRDDRRTAAHAQALERIGVRALVNVPVTEEDGVVAMLYVNSAAPRQWTDEEVDFIREVAARIRTAIARRRAEETVRQNADRLIFLDALARATARAPDADTVMAVTTRLLGEYLGVSNCAYADMEPDQDHFIVRGDWSAPDTPPIVGRYSLKDFGAVTETRLKAGAPLVLNDIPAELPPAQAETFARLGIGATLCMPLVREGRLIAMMAIQKRQAHRWTGQEKALLAEVVARSWAHIERVRSEAGLRDSERRYRSLFENIDTGFSIVEVAFDADGRARDYRFIEVNPAFEVQTGLHGAQGRWMREMRPEHEQYWFDLYGAVARTGESLRRTLHAEALGRWFNIFAIRIGDPEENRVALLFNDITAQKGIEDVLRRSESQFRTMAQAMPNHVWTATPDGMLDWLSDQVSAYGGLDPGALLGAGWTAMVHPEDMPGAAAQWAAALVSGAAYQVEFRLRRADGAYRWHIARAVAVRGETGHIQRWIGTNTDIDDQKNAEVLLERRLEERTAALVKTEQALQQAQKMEAIGNLTGGIAHDFNNLLMAISGSLELLKKRLPPDPMVGRLIDNAMEGTRRGASLTRRMLAFARRQPLQPERINLVQLVGGMTELLERSLGPMVTVETRFPVNLPPVETDPNQLESALLNLVVNARDAMNGEGRIDITARARTLDAAQAMESALKPGAYVCLCVADTGEGMDAQTLKRASEPFFTTKGVGKGTGLGLSMVHGLAEQSGGALVLHSEKGRGTTAEIWLPALSGIVQPVSGRPPAAPPVPVSAMTILAVDDDALVLMNTADMLEDMGHRVAAAGSAADALRLLEDGMAFDLVITDHAMPKMTGAQLAQEIARRRPGLKVLLATGYAELPPEADAGLPLLAKPFTQAELVAALAKIQA